MVILAPKDSYVLWSGGVDSTCLIQVLLERPNTKLHLGYVEIGNNQEKTKAELRAKEFLLPLFKEKFGVNDRINDLGTVLKLETDIDCDKRPFPYPQIPIWLSTILMTVITTYDEIAIGFVCNDSSISWMQEIKEIVASFQKLKYDDHPPMPDVTFPLCKWDKDQVWEHLDPIFKPYVWTCENPQTDALAPCLNECDPCKRRGDKYGPNSIDSLFDLYRKKKLEELITAPKTKTNRRHMSTRKTK